MKKYLLIGFLFVSVITSAQSWLWGEQGNGGAGGNYDEGTSITRDKFGYVYETGAFTGTIYFGSNVLVANSATCFFLVKYDTSGNVIWATQSINSGITVASGSSVATDSAGCVYLVGNFSKALTIGSFNLNNNNNNFSVFLVKYDKNGNVIWARQSVSNGNSDGAGMSVACDVFGKVYIAGYYQGGIKFGANSITCGYQSAFLAKYDSSGNVIWVQQPNNYANYSGASAVCVDPLGNVFITGTLSMKISFGLNILNSTGLDAFIAKYDSGGNVLWAQQSVNGGAQGNAIAADGAGNVYATGSFSKGNAIFGSYTLNYTSGNNFIFFVKYDAIGNVLWATTGTHTDNNSWGGWAVATDEFRNVYLCAGSPVSVRGLHSIAFGSVPLSVSNGFDPVFIMKFDSLGNAICGSMIASGGDDNVGLAVDPTGRYVYVGSDIFETRVALGNDTVGTTGAAEWPFVARWQECCGIKLNLSTSDTAICSGSSLKLAASGGLNYLWSTGATSAGISVSPGSDTIYSVKAGNYVCTIDTAINVVVNPLPVPSVNGTQSICLGKSAVLNAGGGTGYTWMPIAGLSSSNIANPVASPLVTTTYTVTIYNGICSIKDSEVVIVNAIPVISVCCDSTINLGQNVQLNSSGGVSYLWSPSTGLSCYTCPDPIASPLQTTTYSLIVTSDSGCSSNLNLTIDIICGSIFIPDAFSPNDDGQNDILYVRGDCIKTMLFVIFDRWGNKVFESTSLNYGWDGTYKGQPMNIGDYVYYLNATLYNGSAYTKKGSVALVR